MRDFTKIIYHIAVVITSAAVALSLPHIMSFLARNMLLYWALIENEKIFLASIEIGVAVLLITLLNYAGKSFHKGKYSGMAKTAGLEFAGSNSGIFTWITVKSLIKKIGFGKDIMIIGSTGFRTFSDENGPLHNAVKQCREARILLLDPMSEGANARAKSLKDPAITPESLGEQTMKSILFLKALRASSKNIRLKLYQDTPLLKLSIIGDMLSIRHYHTGLDVIKMPEYIFRQTEHAGGLFMIFHQYFISHWDDPEIPEYSLETDELIYRDRNGYEMRREIYSALRAA